MYFSLKYYKVAHVTVLNDETVVDTRFEHLKHRRVVHVVANVFQDIAVRDDSERTEDDPNGNVDLDIRNSRLDDVPGLLKFSNKAQSTQAIPTVFSWLRWNILTWNWEMVLPDFSTAERISARKLMGEGWALAKT